MIFTLYWVEAEWPLPYTEEWSLPYKKYKRNDIYLTKSISWMTFTLYENKRNGL
jgi:hypothetical protein